MMTLVLPFGGDRIPKFSGSGQCGRSMPCVFDGEAFDRDFESALMTDWIADISDYEMPAEDSTAKTPSATNDLKRKSSPEREDEDPPSPKRTRSDDEESTPLQSEVVSSSSESSSSEGGQEEDDFPPRRRVPQMWTSRQRWKDERKKVLKMSITKLSEIEDPELCLHRSVLINNTIRKLHTDIRTERQAKQRHRQQRIDFFGPPPDNFFPSDNEEMLGDFIHQPASDRRASSPMPDDKSDKPGYSPMDVSSDIVSDKPGYSHNGMDVSSDVVSDDAKSPSYQHCGMDVAKSPSYQSSDMDVVSESYVAPTSSSGYTNTDVKTTSVCTFPDVATSKNPTSCFASESSHSPSCVPFFSTDSKPTYTNSGGGFYGHKTQATVASSMPAFPSSGVQCATQYRTNTGSQEVSYPTRVPILDSVVYHSLLASLESS